MARTSSTISSFNIFFSKEFFRGANKRQKQTNLFKVSSNASLYFWVSDVPAVPGQQIIHAIDSGYRNVERIFRRFGRDDSLPHQRLGDIKRLLGDQEKRHIIQYCQPLLSSIRVTGATLTQHRLGHQQLVLVACFPPCQSNLLVSCPKNGLAGASRQVAYDRGFNVNFALHDFSSGQETVVCPCYPPYSAFP